MASLMCTLTPTDGSSGPRQFLDAEILLGRGIDLVTGPPTPGCALLDVPRKHGQVSRKHARLHCEGDKFRVEDLSKHGTFVNGERLAGPRELREGDRIQLGAGGPEFRFSSSLPPAATLENPVGGVRCTGCHEFLSANAVASHQCPVPRSLRRGLARASMQFVDSIATLKLERRFTVLYVLIALLLLAVPTYIVVDRWLAGRESRATQEKILGVRTDVEGVQTKVQGVQTEMQGVQSQVQKGLGDMRAELDEFVPKFDEARLSRSIYRVIAGGGSATAFAVAPGVLATNCHVSQILRNPEVTSWKLIRGDESGAEVTSDEVKDLLDHPSYDPSNGSLQEYDVALIVLKREQLPSHLSLATEAASRSLKRKSPIWIFGFPGALLDAEEILTILASGNVAMVQERGFYHTALSHPGNSGSPLIDVQGRVVGVLVGGRQNSFIALQPATDELGMPVFNQDGSRALQPAQVSIPGGVNYALSVRQLRELMDQHKLQYSE